MDDDDIEELTFDEVAAIDPTTAESHARNALNSLEFALHKVVGVDKAIPIVNAIKELEGFLNGGGECEGAG